MLKKYIGDKAFLKSVLLIAVPIMVQNGITNFVNLLDNIMIGRVGTLQMSGVAITNQLIFVFNLFIFGAISGAGIFTAQYYGVGDEKGVRNTFRFKLVTCLLITLIGCLIFYFCGDALIGLYLQKNESAADIEATLLYGKEYLLIMLIGLIPYSITQAYAGTLRETGETILPMRAGLVAVFVNLVLNYLLIFGKFGFPMLGVNGAAVATVISRFAEFFIVYIRIKRQKEKYSHMNQILYHFSIPGKLAVKITKTGVPLLVNEGLWAMSMAMLNQCYSTRGLDAVAAVNIQSTLWNVFSITFMAMGNAIGIMIGQRLGAGEIEKAKEDDAKLVHFSVLSCIVVAILFACVAKLFPMAYNTSDQVRHLATNLILIGALFMPVDAYTNAAYFTIRAGGKTGITFLFDSFFMWCVNIPIAYVLSRYTAIPLEMLFFASTSVIVLKAIIGFVMVKSGIWTKILV